jgi:hypothetical protein
MTAGGFLLFFFNLGPEAAQLTNECKAGASREQLVMQAWIEQNPALCESIEDDFVRTYCTARAANKPELCGNSTGCTALNGNDVTKCAPGDYECVAVIANNTDVCNQYGEDVDREACIAMVTRNPDAMFDDGMDETCDANTLLHMAIIKKDPSYCDRIEDETYRNSCLEQVRPLV